MFGKKKKQNKCARCGKKLEKKFDYCPYCGYSLKQKDRNEIKDFSREIEKAMKMPFFVKFPFRQLVKQFEKQIDAQMRSIDKDLDKNKNVDSNKIKKIPVSGISISISGSGGKEPVIKMRNLGGKNIGLENINKIKTNANQKIKEEKIALPMTKAKTTKFAKLKKREPKTKIRRMTDKVVYEIDIPGIKSIKDIALTKLENSIEIKALAKDRAYFKLIPISLPIKKYSIDKEKLIIEFVP